MSAAMLIAYTVGSFWFCIPCGECIMYAEPVYEGNTWDCYEYYCDGCGKLLAARC